MRCVAYPLVPARDTSPYHVQSFQNRNTGQVMALSEKNAFSGSGACLRMILSENRYPLFGIRRLFAHDLVRKPVPTFRDQALSLKRVLHQNGILALRTGR